MPHYVQCSLCRKSIEKSDLNAHIMDCLDKTFKRNNNNNNTAYFGGHDNDAAVMMDRENNIDDDNGDLNGGFTIHHHCCVTNVMTHSDVLAVDFVRVWLFFSASVMVCSPGATSAPAPC